MIRCYIRMNERYPVGSIYVFPWLTVVLVVMNSFASTAQSKCEQASSLTI